MSVVATYDTADGQPRAARAELRIPLCLVQQVASFLALLPLLLLFWPSPPFLFCSEAPPAPRRLWATPLFFFHI